MNRHEQEFEEVKKLLKLKQHEVPPPGYFNNFSSQVISRIRAGEAARPRSWSERLQSETGWFQRLVEVFQMRPGVVGGFATCLCLLLLLTVAFSEHSEVSPNTNMLTISAPASPSPGAIATAPVSAPAFASVQPVEPARGITISTNPETSLQPSPMLFGQPSSASLFQTASFVPPGQ